MYLRLAARETFQCRSRIRRIRERLRGKFTDCEFWIDDTAKQVIDDSRIHFQLQPLIFKGEVFDDCDQMELRGLVPEQDPILTDSSIDTSEDEDLLSEVDNFYRNLLNWCEAEEKRKENKDVGRGRELHLQTGEGAATPAKKARYDSEDGLYPESKWCTIVHRIASLPSYLYFATISRNVENHSMKQQ